MTECPCYKTVVTGSNLIILVTRTPLSLLQRGATSMPFPQWALSTPLPQQLMPSYHGGRCENKDHRLHCCHKGCCQHYCGGGSSMQSQHGEHCWHHFHDWHCQHYCITGGSVDAVATWGTIDVIMTWGSRENGEHCLWWLPWGMLSKPLWGRVINAIAPRGALLKTVATGGTANTLTP